MPLQPDTLLIEQLETDRRYDYDAVPEESLSLLNSIEQFFNDMLNSVAGDITRTQMRYFAIIVAVLALIWLLYSGRLSRLFQWALGSQQPYTPDDTELDIRRTDLDSALADAVKRADFRAAIALVYLITLRKLHTDGHIDWQPQKPPLQYTREYRDSDFRQLTNAFLRIRYGGFEATKEAYDEALRLSRKEVNHEG